jgi:hypothetical protein
MRADATRPKRSRPRGGRLQRANNAQWQAIGKRSRRAVAGAESIVENALAFAHSITLLLSRGN